MPDVALLVSLLQLAVKDRTQLALENIALRHQLSEARPGMGVIRRAAGPGPLAALPLVLGVLVVGRRSSDP